jgi:hypothetical protein
MGIKVPSISIMDDMGRVMGRFGSVVPPGKITDGIDVENG